MSKRLKNGVWEVPQEQVNEFMQYIDYRKLIEDCLESKTIKNMGQGKEFKRTETQPVRKFRCW